jgi:hypothetical protein
MYFPYCLRCHTLNNFGDKNCGSCKVTFSVARAVNTAIDKFHGNKQKTMKYLGITNRNRFYELTECIPEISNAWEFIKDRPIDEVTKIIGSKVLNKANPTQLRLLKALPREYDYCQMTSELQREFVDWVLENWKTLSRKQMRNKLPKPDRDVIVI